MSRYRFVSAMKAEGFPVTAACETAEVSTSAYYDWLERSGAPTRREVDEAVLVNEMRDVHSYLDDTYGSPRMTGELRRRGYDVNHKRTERLMRNHEIVARDGRRRKVRTTIPDLSAPPLPDLVGRDFSVGAPGVRTCGDITYIGTGEGWLYLASVLDLGSRRLVGYATGEHMPWELCAEALEMAIATRCGDVSGMVFHHDRGSQGEFNWSLQRLSDGGVKRWESPSSRRQPGRCGASFVLRVTHRDGSETNDSGSGARSPKASRPRMQPPRPAWHPRLAPGGSERLAGCDRSALPRRLAVT